MKEKIETQWRRGTNEEVPNKYGEPNITDIINSQKVRWLGDVTRLPRDGFTNITLRTCLIGDKRRRRPRRKIMDAVEEDLRKLGVADWTGAVNDRKRRKGINGL